MKLLVLASMLAAASAGILPSYSFPTPSGQPFSHGTVTSGQGFSGFSDVSGLSTAGTVVSGSSSISSAGSVFSGGAEFTSVGVGASEISCGEGQVRHVDGSCVTPQVTRNLFLYEVPPATPIVAPRPNVPPPRIEHNTVFIRVPEGLLNPEPVVIPPPQQRNVVYVLSKRPHIDHTVVNAPEQEQAAPEVYFVNYAEGENPTLPHGGDLESALSAAAPGGGELVQTSDSTASSSSDFTSGPSLVSGSGVVSVRGASSTVSSSLPSLYSVP